MPLDLYPNAKRELNDYVATQPAYGPPSNDIVGAFFTSAQANASAFGTLRATQNSQQLVHDWLDAFEAQTGQKIDPFSNAMPGSFNYDTLNKAYQTAKASRPGFDLTPPPTPEQAWQHAMDIERQFADENARLQSRPQTGLSALGSMLGTLTPSSLLLAPLGAVGAGGDAAGVVVTALREGAALAAGQAAISTAAFPVSKGLNPDYGASDVAKEAIDAGLFGATLGGVIRLGVPAVAAAWTRVRTGAWPQAVKDAGNVVTRQAVNATGDPNVGRGAGPSGTVSFAQNVKAAEAAVAAGKPVEPTPDLFTRGTYRPAQVFAADGRPPINVQYEVVEANSLVTSNRPDLTPNPAYPPELQPRDRTRAASADQINAIAARLEPERLGPSAEAGTGAPIVGPDGVVESGNGRVLALLKAYQADGGQAAAYRAFLAKQGFDVTAMRNPVMIARRITTLDGQERASFANAANQAVAMRMSAPEQAAADARLLNEPTLGQLVHDKGIDTADNRPFVRSFVAQLPKEERGSLVDRSGALSVEGERRVQAALLARAYGDPALLSRLLESPEAGMKGIGGALTDAAGPWAALRAEVSRGTVSAQMDITPDLLNAFRLVQKARARGLKASELLAQSDMFGADAVTPTTRALLGLMFRDENLTKAASRPSIARALRAYAEEAAKNTTDARLFEGAIGAGDVLQTALAKAGREDLAAGAEASLVPDLLATKAAEPVTDDASVHALDHLLETNPDAMIADPLTLNADGSPVMRSVREVLDEVDAEIAAAKEIEACASGEMAAAA